MLPVFEAPVSPNLQPVIPPLVCRLTAVYHNLPSIKKPVDNFQIVKRFYASTISAVYRLVFDATYISFVLINGNCQNWKIHQMLFLSLEVAHILAKVQCFSTKCFDAFWMNHFWPLKSKILKLQLLLGFFFEIFTRTRQNEPSVLRPIYHWVVLRLSWAEYTITWLRSNY